VTQVAASPRRVRREVDARHQRAVRTGPPLARRGRHATPVGQGFGYLVGWTILGTMVPGSGLVAAGRRMLGGLIITGTVVLGAAAAAFVLVNGNQKAVIRLGSDTDFLLVAAVSVTTLGLVWALVVLGTHGALRRGAELSGGQKVLAFGLVLALVGAIGIPTAEATRYTLIHRDLVMTIFSDEDDPTTGVKPQAEKPNPWAGIPRVNVMLLGGDDGAGRVGTRPDTVILASVDTRTGNTVLFNIPRNLEKAPFPPGTQGHAAWPDGFGPTFGGPQYNCGQSGELCFFNAIWATAEANRQYFPGVRNPGLLATKQAVEGVLGLKVDYYGKLNLAGFEDFVDAIGGVTLNVKRDIPIGGGTNQLTGGKNPIHGWIRTGRRHLNGKYALWFARSREGSDNWERMQRQQCVIGALTRQADPLKVARAYPRLAVSAKKNISTNIPRQQIDAWVELALKVKDAEVTSLTLNKAVIGGDAANPDFYRIQLLVRRAIRASTAPKPTPTPTVDPVTGATVTPSPTSSPRRTQRPTTTRTVDPSRAQSITDIC